MNQIGSPTYVIGDRHSASVLETAQMLVSVVKGTLGGVQRDELERAAKWLEWRLSDAWDEPRSGNAMLDNYDLWVRTAAYAAIVAWLNDRPIRGVVTLPEPPAEPPAENKIINSMKLASLSWLGELLSMFDVAASVERAWRAIETDDGTLLQRAEVLADQLHWGSGVVEGYLEFDLTWVDGLELSISAINNDCRYVAVLGIPRKDKEAIELLWQEFDYSSLKNARAQAARLLLALDPDRQWNAR